MDLQIPTLNAIQAAAKLLKDKILYTPTWQWRSKEKDNIFGENTEIFLKLELWQYAGSFKPRGALLNILALTKEQLQNGVTAISAGNHAIAVAFAAQKLGVNAKVVIPKTVNPFRLARCRSYGAEVVFSDTFIEGFKLVQKISQEESRPLIHPFEGYNTALGTATVGLEFAEQVKNLDAIIVAIGGGGLIAGVSTAFKYLQPNCKIYGVEPEGAAAMLKSFAANKPVAIDKIATIADSLGAPKTEPYSFQLCKKNVDKIVMVSDAELVKAMIIIADELKMLVEPACAAALAALMYPLKQELGGKRVGLLFCGSNIDVNTFCKYTSKI